MGVTSTQDHFRDHSGVVCTDDTSSANMSLPSWAQKALQGDKLAQPWKTQDLGKDDPTFGEGEDLLELYNKGIKCSPTEGSLAA